MSDKNQPSITCSISEVREVMCAVYSESHELIITGYGVSAIADQWGNNEQTFEDDTELYKWTLEQRAKLDEQETKQSAANNKINHESASVDFMNQRF